MDLRFHSADEEAKCRIHKIFNCDLSAAWIDAIGGEPLAGSGFETEEPELGFSAAELDGKE